MRLANIVLQGINELKNKFIVPKDLEDEDGEVIPKGTKVKILKTTKHGDIRDFKILSPDGLESVISMPSKQAKALGLIK
mgnify:FL=1|jgi:hypothetical protein